MSHNTQLLTTDIWRDSERDAPIACDTHLCRLATRSDKVPNDDDIVLNSTCFSPRVESAFSCRR